MIPIDYYSKGVHAIKAHNVSRKDDLQELDVKILNELSLAKRGYPAMQLRKAVQDEKKIYSAVFNRGINRLLSHEYITRKPHRRWIYYTITMRGRNTLQQINDTLVKIVEDQHKARNKQP